jgi:hypothetical protein
LRQDAGNDVSGRNYAARDQDLDRLVKTALDLAPDRSGHWRPLGNGESLRLVLTNVPLDVLNLVQPFVWPVPLKTANDYARDRMEQWCLNIHELTPADLVAFR